MKEDLQALHDGLLGTYARRWVDFTHGSGARLYDSQGRDYIDFGSGIGVNALGHGNQKLAQAIAHQAQKLIHVSNLYANCLQAQLARKILCCSQLDGAVFFSNSGAEANECAIKIARKYGERKHKNCYEIITLQSSFHGRTIATLKATGQERFHKHFAPFPDGFKTAASLDEVTACLSEKTCAVLIEPIQGEGGVMALDAAKLRDLAGILKEKDILLMADEIQSGVYRSGEFLACRKLGIEPDVFTLAKGLGGGVPIGATFSRIKDIFSYGDHGSTFGGNPLSMRAGLCVLEILEEHQGSGRLRDEIEKWDQKLTSILESYGDLFSGCSGLGLMRGLLARSRAIQETLLHAAFEKRLLILESGRNVVRFLPPLLLEDEDREEGFERLQAALEATRQSLKS